MTYANISSNIEVSKPELKGIAAAVIDTRTVDEAGFKADGITKYFKLDLKPAYTGRLRGGVLLWGGYVINAREVITELQQGDIYNNSEDAGVFLDLLNGLAVQVVNTHERQYLERKNRELTQRFSSLRVKGMDATVRTDLIQEFMASYVLQAEQNRRDFRPTFAYIGFEDAGNGSKLGIHAVYDEEVRLPPQNFFEIGAIGVLKSSTGSSGVMDADELQRQNIAGLVYNGVAGAMKYSDNILTGGTHAIITFQDGNIGFVHRDFCSFITNAVTASIEGYTSYPREQAIQDIETILARDSESRATGTLENPERFTEDGAKLSGIAARLGDSVLNLMSGRMGRRIFRRRHELAQKIAQM